MKTQQLRMTVQGMTCDSCNRHVEHALESAGAQNVRADFRGGEAVFTFTGEDMQPLEAAVTTAGYRPSGVEFVKRPRPDAARRSAAAKPQPDTRPVNKSIGGCKR